jgi:predicted MFS family arabinose efflux permease
MALQKMTSMERRSVFTLALIMALRMLGLFMVIPLFALYVSHLPGTTPLLVGLTMGIYGLTQAIFQIPLGALSDRIGRKKVIVLGLTIFMIGSIVAALSHSIGTTLLGRALQGAGAVGSTIMAFVADLTREEQRTKAMAITGMTIGMSFSIAMVLGPILAPWIQVQGIFWLAASFSIIGMFILFIFVPTHTQPTWHPETEPDFRQLSDILKHPELARFNIGIFCLHAIFTASFIVIPISLQTLAGLHSNHQWALYLPTLMLAFCISVVCIVIAEKKHSIKPFFIAAVLLLTIAEISLWIFAKSLLLSALNLLLFFTAFSLLEAFLPSLVSKTAPPARKGTALGIYSFSQFSGIFVGGAVGGWLYGAFGLTDVHLFCAILAIIWLGIAFTMKNPQYSLQPSSV